MHGGMPEVPTSSPLHANVPRFSRGGSLSCRPPSAANACYAAAWLLLLGGELRRILVSNCHQTPYRWCRKQFVENTQTRPKRGNDMKPATALNSLPVVEPELNVVDFRDRACALVAVMNAVGMHAIPQQSADI